MEKIFLPIDIVSQLSSTFSNGVYNFKTDKKLKHTEEGDGNELTISLDDDNYLLFHLSKIKSLSKYLNQVHPPKDCDIMLVNIDKKIVYLIEVKLSRCSNGYAQIRAGQKWLDHIVFCFRKENPVENNEYRIMKFISVVDGVVSKQFGSRFRVHEKDCLVCVGNKLRIDEITTEYNRQII